ncbi:MULTISPECIES: N-acetyl sugar amidotransferase [unclassified Halomonas]|uniref:N-acetyl sugar amidotransferase n=1 Tax=unclassified Halomonas TaxID=2609666 RepID=UPI0007D9A09F|nr:MULTISPECIES: N-acetyl sugar amidotransferase [unclassified Halomonas]MBT2786007.1 N-acetyl sugar amidotransferase [Halomonas sp. ISL-106]MBT2797029.1 N-acetyl sugar amidotransferase [Halomonas sp. ISL-104]OAL58416.1 LPS biosynthesis protein [Halomonas sp. ALS9]
MKYCKTCLTTDLRPNAQFSGGICIACRYATTSSNGSSSLKLRQLEELIAAAKKKQRSKGSYDCIVGVSGGKDSTRQAHWVRDRLGLRPLLVCAAYPPKQMSDIGAENLSNLISMGFDLMAVTPAPKTAASLALESFEKFGNVCKSTEMSLFSTVPRLAIEHGVNMIFWGENPALQVGDSAVEGVDEFDGNNLRKLNTLTEGGNDWITSFVTESYKAKHYFYPGEIQFKRKKIKIFYLGAAWDDWSNEQNSTYAALQGLTLRPGDEVETGDISNASMLDEEFTNINMMLKYYKFGFGRATDLVNEKIRGGELSREEGVEIVKKYDGVCSDRIINGFCDYVGIDNNRFWTIANKWINVDLFDVSITGRPQPKFEVGVDSES